MDDHLPTLRLCSQTGNGSGHVFLDLSPAGKPAGQPGRKPNHSQGGAISSPVAVRKVLRLPFS
jgi:hypothetical protein